MSLKGNRRIRRSWHGAKWPRFYWLWDQHNRRFWPWAGWGEFKSDRT